MTPHILRNAIEQFEHGAINEFQLGWVMRERMMQIETDKVKDMILALCDWFSACTEARATRCATELEFGFTEEQMTTMEHAWATLGGTCKLAELVTV